ncbi:hypothetical protein RFI_17635 [Reticulomyxa filosa]|uniref:Protein kinase domain-containing protein n=1 Tax=Reticulomyxa filosa TaxID=46433 RepID=X6MZY9_RETFI|nr:hypothetical protein RFI_17635 [Reticulomyxa filosa]|eukprot:ETO19595.1 hypothetical protein RFI_17635 [Reticulomyxa filosa]
MGNVSNTPSARHWSLEENRAISSQASEKTSTVESTCKDQMEDSSSKLTTLTPVEYSSLDSTSNNSVENGVKSESNGNKKYPVMAIQCQTKNEKCGCYNIIEKISGGSSCQVMKVQDTKSGVECAMKQIPVTFCCCCYCLNFFFKKKKKKKKEDLTIKLGALKTKDKIKQNKKTRLVDHFSDDRFHYIVTELGVNDLFRLVQGGKRLAEHCVRDIVGGLLKTLDVLHEFGICHCDIKPENMVFVPKSQTIDHPLDVNNSRESSGLWKLVDFGDACVVQDTQIYQHFIGTQNYLAPERWRQRFGWEMKG